MISLMGRACTAALSVLTRVRAIVGRSHRATGVIADQGSIGEWVMILVMAVGIVLFIWSIAEPMLGAVLRNALSKLFR